MTNRTLLMVDHSDRSNPDIEDIKEVEAYIVGGLEGVFAIYRLENLPSIYYFASGDDGNWWRISNGLHATWLTGVISAITEADKDYVKELMMKN